MTARRRSAVSEKSLSLAPESDKGDDSAAPAAPSTPLLPSHDRLMTSQTPASFAHLEGAGPAPTGTGRSAEVVTVDTGGDEGSDVEPPKKRKTGRAKGTSNVRSQSMGSIDEGTSKKAPKKNSAPWVAARLDEKAGKLERLIDQMAARINDALSTAESARMEIASLRDKIARLEGEIQALREERGRVYDSGSESNDDTRNAASKRAGKRKATTPDNEGADVKRARRDRSPSAPAHRDDEESEGEVSDEREEHSCPSPPSQSGERRPLMERISSPSTHRERTPSPPRTGTATRAPPPPRAPEVHEYTPNDEPIGKRFRPYAPRGESVFSSQNAGPSGTQWHQTPYPYPNKAGNRGGHNSGGPSRGFSRGNQHGGRGGAQWVQRGGAPQRGTYQTEAHSFNARRSASPPPAPAPPPPSRPSDHREVKIGEVTWVAGETRASLKRFIEMIQAAGIGPLPTPNTVSEPTGRRGRYILVAFETSREAEVFVKLWDRWRVGSSQWKNVTAVIE
ncbi:hypothetical protein B0H11DRAFT_2253986 [Mycena galericulata]|nr:hypothetical protein B0H11DRAFT_2253986 [Mycena galericulata]